MTLGTHIAFASVLYLGGATLFGYRPDWISWLLAAVASGLPDIDLPTSKIGRLFWFISAPLERRFGHRTLTHSLAMLIALAVATYPLAWIQPLYWGSVVGGYRSLWLKPGEAAALAAGEEREVERIPAQLRGFL